MKRGDIVKLLVEPAKLGIGLEHVKKGSIGIALGNRRVHFLFDRVDFWFVSDHHAEILGQVEEMPVEDNPYE